MFKLIIGNRAYSSWSMRGWLACKQAGEDFEELVVPMFDADWEKRREGDEFAPSLGKVPILWDGEIVVWDSLAIVEFLADRYGSALYWPEEEGARGMARSMAAEMHSGFANLRRDLPMNVRKSFPAKELGEEVRAVVQLVHPEAAGDELARQLLEHCYERLAKYKCPRTIEFAAELPRQQTGKLYKRLLREQYAAAARRSS